MIWLFGGVIESKVHLSESRKMGGFLELENANVRWFLSIEHSDLPQDLPGKDKSSYRSIIVDGKEIEFSEGFTALHTRSYKEILKGNGFKIKDARHQ